MRIAYFAHLNDGRGSGVVAKVATQLDLWRREGHTARIFVATKDAELTWVQALGDCSVRRYGGSVSRLGALSRLVRDIRSFRPHVIYVRWDLFYPPMVCLPTGVPLVAEVNTDDLTEDALGSLPRAWYNRLTRRFWLRRASGMVFVSSELSQLSSFRKTGARRCVVTNGIALSAYPWLPAPAAGAPRLAFVGTGDVPWHGVDKVLRLAALRPGWQFDIVGSKPIEAAVASNVTWHPPLDRDGVLRVLGQADVGIGTMALHRKAMMEASPLKVREYLAVGLPVVLGYRDADAEVDELREYVLRIANSETNVEDEISRIDAFVTSARGRRVPRVAVSHIDAVEKERQRLALFDELART